MSLCAFGRDLTCATCGYVAKRLPTYRVCRPLPDRAWQPVMVGDLLERWLTRIGITRDRVERWTRTAELPGGCGCDRRKRWINEVCSKIQVATRKRFAQVRRFCFGS